MTSIMKDIPNDVLSKLKLYAHLYEKIECKNKKYKLIKASPDRYEVMIDHVNEDGEFGFIIIVKSDLYTAIPDVDYIIIYDSFGNVMFSIDLYNKITFDLIDDINKIYTILDFNFTKCDVYKVNKCKMKRLSTTDIMQFAGVEYNYKED